MSRGKRIAISAGIGIGLVSALGGALALLYYDTEILAGTPAPWTAEEVATLRSLWIGTLPPLPVDRSDRVADDPRAAKLGQRLFFDVRLSGNGEVACATCHQPARRFTDGRQKGHAIGTSKRNTPSIVGVAYSPWLYWDGRKDSLWAQALSPAETPVEQGGTRMQIARLVTTDPKYREAYEALFGPPPDFSDRSRFPAKAAPIAGTAAGAAWNAMASEDQELVTRTFVNVGKAIEAYERRLMPSPSRFDKYVKAVLDGDEAAQHTTFDDTEIRGLRLFIGKANCTRCHNGPLLTNNEFANTGVLSFPGEVPDEGRSRGVETLLRDPFNCLGRYSDDPKHECEELRYVRTDALVLLGALRTPSLRNLAGTQPYMHKGQIATLKAVLEHYNRAQPAMIGHNEAVPLKLSRRELHELEAFLATLDAPLATPPEMLAPPADEAVTFNPPSVPLSRSQALTD